MDKLKPIVISAVALIITFILGRYTSPTPEAKIEYRVKEVVKEVIKEVVVENKNIDIIKKKTTTQDGTIIEEETLKDRSQINTAKDTSKDTLRHEEFKKEDISLNKSLFFSVSNPVKFKQD